VWPANRVQQLQPLLAFAPPGGLTQAQTDDYSDAILHQHALGVAESCLVAHDLLGRPRVGQAVY